MSGLRIELVSPEAKVMSGEVFAAAIPSVEGEMTVLLGHAPTVCALNAGLVRLYGDALSSHPRSYFVSGGFCDVSETGCTILAEEAMPQSELNASELDAEITDLNERIAGTTDAATLAALRADLALTETKRRFAA